MTPSQRYKRYMGCLICERKDNLTYHHLNPREKRLEIGDRGLRNPLVWKEITKCAVLCRDCHDEVERRKLKNITHLSTCIQ